MLLQDVVHTYLEKPQSHLNFLHEQTSTPLQKELT